MSNNRIMSLPSVQLSPVHPLEQMQLYEPLVFVQVPPFKHGELLHSSISENEEKPFYI